MEQESVVDGDFPERLKAGFLEEYYRLGKNGHKGDDLFDLMCEFSHGDEKTVRALCWPCSVDIPFERCEVFEK